MIGASGASFKRVASTRRGHWPRQPDEPQSIASFISARQAPMAIQPIEKPRLMKHLRSDRKSGCSIITHAAKSIASSYSGKWPSAGLPLTVIRPSWLFGERDRTTAPRLVREFRQGRMMVVGKGDNPLSAVYAGNCGGRRHPGRARPGSAGEAYNITSHGRITQREFLDLFADALAVPRVSKQVPYALAFTGGFLLEMQDQVTATIPAPSRDPVRRLAVGSLP